MFTVISQQRRAGAAVSRQRWHFEASRRESSAAAASAVLVERLAAVAAELAGPWAGGLMAVDSLELVRQLEPGDLLEVTAAAQPRGPSRVAVSVVARRATQTQTQTRAEVVAVAVVTFTRQAPGATAEQLDGHDGRDAARGSSPVATRFLAHPRAEGSVPSNIVAWVQASALMSAQGAAAAPVQLVGVRAVSVLQPLRPDAWLELECSVVSTFGDELTVLSHLRTTGGRNSVLCALSQYRRTPEAPEEHR